MLQRTDTASITSVRGGTHLAAFAAAFNQGDRDMHGPSAVGSQASTQLIQVQAQNPQQKQAVPDTKQAKGSPEGKTAPASGNSACGMNMDVSA